jgi:hypothetical protein
MSLVLPENRMEFSEGGIPGWCWKHHNMHWISTEKEYVPSKKAWRTCQYGTIHHLDLFGVLYFVVMGR